MLRPKCPRHVIKVTFNALVGKSPPPPNIVQLLGGGDGITPHIDTQFAVVLLLEQFNELDGQGLS